MALPGSAGAWLEGAQEPGAARRAAGEEGVEARGGSGRWPRRNEQAMQGPRLLLGSARRWILGSTEAALWGELGGPWREGEALSSAPREGTAWVGEFDSVPFQLKDPLLSARGFSARLQFLFLQIPGGGSAAALGDAGRLVNIAPGSSRRKAFAKVLVLD